VCERVDRDDGAAEEVVDRGRAVLERVDDRNGTAEDVVSGRRLQPERTALSGWVKFGVIRGSTREIMGFHTGSGLG
jgi:hypothetical protein